MMSGKNSLQIQRKMRGYQKDNMKKVVQKNKKVYIIYMKRPVGKNKKKCSYPDDSREINGKTWRYFLPPGNPKNSRGQNLERTAHDKFNFYCALQENLGLVIKATKVTGTSGAVHWYWMKNDPRYKEVVDELIELKRDFVEKQLQDLVGKKDPTCVTFASKCLLRPRGYDQSTEIKNADPDGFKLNIESSVLNQVLQTIYKNSDSGHPDAPDDGK